MIKHTPGPWSLKKTSGYSCGPVAKSKGYNIEGPQGTVFHLPTAGLCQETANADAVLAAAAPDLLAACEVADAWFREQGDNDTHAEVVRAAIAKAKGESQ
jgi:hypothetical protein